MAARLITRSSGRFIASLPPLSTSSTSIIPRRLLPTNSPAACRSLRRSLTSSARLLRLEPVPEHPAQPTPPSSSETPSSTPTPPKPPPNAHVLFYREIIPAMFPILLLGSAVFVVRVTSLLRLFIYIHDEVPDHWTLKSCSDSCGFSSCRTLASHSQSLQLAQAYLSHEKYATEAKAQIDELERELHELRAAQAVEDAHTSQSIGTAASVVKQQSKSFLGRWWG